MTSLKVIASLAKNKNFCEINDHDLIRVFVNVTLSGDSSGSHFFSITSSNFSTSPRNNFLKLETSESWTTLEAGFKTRTSIVRPVFHGHSLKFTRREQIYLRYFNFCEASPLKSNTCFNKHVHQETRTYKINSNWGQFESSSSENSKVEVKWVPGFGEEIKDLEDLEKDKDSNKGEIEKERLYFEQNKWISEYARVELKKMGRDLNVIYEEDNNDTKMETDESGSEKEIRMLKRYEKEEEMKKLDKMMNNVEKLKGKMEKIDMKNKKRNTISNEISTMERNIKKWIVKLENTVVIDVVDEIRDRKTSYNIEDENNNSGEENRNEDLEMDKSDHVKNKGNVDEDENAMDEEEKSRKMVIKILAFEERSLNRRNDK